jgi:hypothetical protein
VITDLFDIGDLGRESLGNLRNDLLNKWLMLHCLPCFHDSASFGFKLDCHWDKQDSLPDNRCLNDILSIFVHRLKNISGLRFGLCLDRQIEVDANLL